MPGTASNSGRCSVLYHSLNSWSCSASISTYTKKIPRPFCAMGPSPLLRSVSLCGPVACAPAIPFEPHARRVHAEQPSAHPVHDDTSPCGALESRLGSTVDGCGRWLGTVVSCPPGRRSVIDPPRGSRRHVALLDGGHPERRHD